MTSASFAVSSLHNALGVPSAKIPIDGATFVSYLLPPIVCYFLAALLAVTPQTRVIRVALCPLIALLALRAALSVDMSLGVFERRFLNIDLVLFMFSVATHALDWALAKGPLVRRRPVNRSPSTIIDAFDLISNLRGHGWEWSRGLYIPRETRPTNRVAFVLYTFFSAVVHTLICGAFQRAVLALAPTGGGSILEGSTILDDTLPFLLRYLRASIISTLIAFAIYAVLQMNYDLITILAVLVLRQEPAQWPPVFDAPWCATSLSDFWGRRWHQLFRRIFLFIGGYPLSRVLGRSGIVIGAFLASGFVHHLALITLNSQMEMWWMLTGFGMMAPGILAERAFLHLTGRRVGGAAGWVWTMTWLLFWGNVMVEGFGRAGMFGCAGFVDNLLPVRIPLEQLVTDFDGWLHTI